MSIPEDTPAAVTYFPSNTTRSPVGRAPCFGSCSRYSQWLVAFRPSSSPAAASSRDPVHTEVVQVVVASTVRSQSMTTGLAISRSGCGPPGTMTMSGRVTSSSPLSATSASAPLSVRTGPGRSETKTTSASVSRPRVSKGPMASRAVKWS